MNVIRFKRDDAFWGYDFPIGISNYPNHSVLKTDLVRIIDETESTLKSGEKLDTNHAGTHVDSELTLNYKNYNILDRSIDTPSIREFKKWFSNEVFEFLKEINYGSQTFYAACWANKLRYLERLAPHVHAGAGHVMGFSAHYDVSIPSEYNYTRYMSPMHELLEDSNEILKRNREGELTVFSNRQPHATIPNRHPTLPRYTLGIDIYLTTDDERDTFPTMRKVPFVHRIDRHESN